MTRGWARRGSRPRAPRDCRYAFAYLSGAVRPERATGAGLVLPRASKEAMRLHLAEIGREAAPGAHAILALDGAGRHGRAGLDVPDNLTLLPLPPYGPELNPVENVRRYLRRNQPRLRVWDDCNAIVESCCQAWNAPMDTPERLGSITRRSWAKTVGEQGLWYKSGSYAHEPVVPCWRPGME